jgi:hypothetical protein
VGAKPDSIRLVPGVFSRRRAMWVGDWKADLDFRALEQPELEAYQVGR